MLLMYCLTYCLCLYVLALKVSLYESTATTGIAFVVDFSVWIRVVFVANFIPFFCANLMVCLRITSENCCSASDSVSALTQQHKEAGETTCGSRIFSHLSLWLRVYFHHCWNSGKKNQDCVGEFYLVSVEFECVFRWFNKAIKLIVVQ